MPCWQAAVHVPFHGQLSDRESIAEEKYHDTVLRPKIEQAFQQLANAEKKLKAA